jgi:hypothetical protein
MANPPVRGLRQSIPSGTVLGRTEGGFGPARAITLAEITNHVITTGKVISSGGAIPQQWEAGSVNALAPGLAITTGTLISNYQAPLLTTIGDGLSLATGTISVGTLAYSNLPASADIRTLSFNMTGTLPGKQAYSMIMTQPGTLLANGGVFESYIPTNPTSTNTLVINTIHGTTVTPQATIAISVSGSISGVTFAAVPMAAGDVVQFVNQDTADATFADPVFALQYQVS